MKNPSPDVSAEAPASAPSSINPSPAVLPGVRKRAAQNRQLAEAAARAERLARAGQENADVAEALARFGFSANQLKEGILRADRAHATLDDRQVAMARSTASRAERDEAMEATRQDYLTLRTAVKKNFKGSERTPLGGTDEPLSKGPEKFLQSMQSVYAAAVQAQQQAVLGKFGFDAERFARVKERLDTFAQRQAVYLQADHAAVAATAARDAAVKELASWANVFERHARVVLGKRQPELLAKLGLTTA